jgi:hypothetical protein
MSLRMRVVSWRVQPVVMADDGDTLTPVPVSALDIPATAWEQWKAGGDEESLAQVRAQVETPSTEED